MTAKTHKAGGVFFSVIAFHLLSKNGLLLPNVNVGLQWLVIYPFCYWGSVASDLDHHWGSCPSRDYPSRLINVGLHVTKPLVKKMDEQLTPKQKRENIVYRVCDTLNASHRSWQTHSELPLIIIMALLYYLLYYKIPSFGDINTAIASLVLTGAGIGIISHLVLDLLTPEGIWCVAFRIINWLFGLVNVQLALPEKIHLVPNVEFFATGGKWEKCVQKVLSILTWVSLAYIVYNLIYPSVEYYTQSFY